MAEGRPRRQSGRGPLPHDGHRDGVEPEVLGDVVSTSTAARSPTRWTPCGICGPSTPTRSSTSSRVADALESILSWQDWRSCSRWRNSSASRGRLRAAHRAPLVAPRAAAARCGDVDRDPRAGDLVHRVPAARQRAPAGLVPRAGRGGAVHQQANLYRPHGVERLDGAVHDVGAGPGATPGRRPSQSSVQAEPENTE